MCRSGCYNKKFSWRYREERLQARVTNDQEARLGPFSQARFLRLAYLLVRGRWSDLSLHVGGGHRSMTVSAHVELPISIRRFQPCCMWVHRLVMPCSSNGIDTDRFIVGLFRGTPRTRHPPFAHAGPR